MHGPDGCYWASFSRQWLSAQRTDALAASRVVDRARGTMRCGTAPVSCHLVMSQTASLFGQIRAPTSRAAFGMVQHGQARVELYLDGRWLPLSVKQMQLVPSAAGRPGASRVLSRALASNPNSFGTVVRSPTPGVGSLAGEDSSPAWRVV